MKGVLRDYLTNRIVPGDVVESCNQPDQAENGSQTKRSEYEDFDDVATVGAVEAVIFQSSFSSVAVAARAADAAARSAARAASGRIRFMRGVPFVSGFRCGAGMYIPRQTPLILPDRPAKE